MANNLLHNHIIPKQWSKAIVAWYHVHQRELPWRSIQNPYFTWISEVILQQTRVEQGLPYFIKITQKWPTVKDLAAAKDDDFFKAWEGLGYYSRARNALKCAREVANVYHGSFPNNFDDLLKLPGVGPYTASAIASIAFQEPKGVVDGNVFRLITRVNAWSDDISDLKTRKKTQEWVDEYIDKEHPGDFNQAMMELGATICTPKNPKCAECPVSSSCLAFKLGQQTHFPVKTKKVKVKPLYVTYFCVLDVEGNTYIRKRKEGIWNQLYEFYGVWNSKETENEVPAALKSGVVTDEFSTLHKLTHKNIYLKLKLVQVKSLDEDLEGFEKTPLKDLKKKAFPKPLHQFLEKQDFYVR